MDDDDKNLKGDAALLHEAHERLKNCIDDEDTERNKMRDDLRFGTLDQWPAEVRQARERDPNGARPCLTIDKLNQYVVQVVNEMRQNRPAIKIRPVDDAADIETSKIFQGLVRYIEDQSNAHIAYETAGESSTRIGLGYFRITTEYESPGSFDQEIRILRIPDTFCVYLGPHIQPDGSDAEFGFVLERVPMDRFEREWPKAKSKEADFDELGDQPTWRTDDFVTVAEYFYKEYTPAELLFLADGREMTREDYDAAGETTPIGRTRDTQLETVKWCKLTGAEILQKRDWAGKYIPIVEVIGKESYVDGKRILWGLTRPVKDNLRMYNYWASAATERMALAPKTPFIGATGQFRGKEDQWKKANVENRAYLEYDPIDVNGTVLPAPKRVEPAPVEVAMVHMMQTIEHDVQASLGMFKAAVGEPQGQQSGRAILALQRESDTGTLHFADNLSNSICHAGAIIVDLIPKIYDTRRVLRIMGEDGEAGSATIDPAQPQAMRRVQSITGQVQTIYNLGVGKYDVTVTVGPSYNTKRMEAATTFAELAKGAADPMSAAVMRYLTVKNSDFTSSEEATRMLKALLPPPLQHDAAEGEPPVPPSALQKMQQMSQQAQMMQQGLQELQQENLKLKSGEQSKMAAVQADAQKGQAELQLKAQLQQQELAFEREKAQAQLALEQEKARSAIELERVKAGAQIELAQAKQQADAQCANMKMQSDQQMATAKLQFDMQCRSEDQKAQVLEKEETAAVQAMPKLESLLTQILQVLKNPPPRQVQIGALQKNPSGQITGASVTQTLQ